jgi:hypothetical protein
MNTFSEFPDAEKVIQALLVKLIPDIFEPGDGPAHTSTSLSTVVAERLPLAVVGRIGGVTTPLEDFPILDIESFAETKPAAISLDARISAALLGYPHSVELGTRTVVLDRFTQSRGQVELPWDDSDIRRIASTYQFSVRR